MDIERFKAACTAVAEQGKERNGIGTLGEKTLHAVLKRYYEPDGERQEVRLGRYVADIVNEDGIIEVQTQNFHSLRKKLEAFLPCGRVTVVYPIARTKWMCWVDCETGEVTQRHKSPKTGAAWDVLPELYKIKQLLDNPNLSLRLVLLELTEYRQLDGWSRDKKRGSTRAERIPSTLLDEVQIDALWQYEQLLPPGLPEMFSTRDYAKAAKRNISFGQTALHVLHHLGVVRRMGKVGNSYLYCTKP